MKELWGQKKKKANLRIETQVLKLHYEQTFKETHTSPFRNRITEISNTRVRSLFIFPPSLFPHVSEHFGVHVFLFVQAVLIASATRETLIKVNVFRFFFLRWRLKCSISLHRHFPQKVVNVTVKWLLCLSGREAVLGALVLLQLHVGLVGMTSVRIMD